MACFQIKEQAIHRRVTWAQDHASLDPASLVWWIFSEGFSEAIAGITYQRVWMDFIMIEYTSFSNPDWVDQKGNWRAATANIDTFEAFWICIPYLQLSKSIRNIVIALLEQKILWNRQKFTLETANVHMLPHRWFTMHYISLAAHHYPFPVPMPSQFSCLTP